MAQIYSGTVGVSIQIDTGINLSGASITQIYAKRPDGSLVIWPATVALNTTTGVYSLVSYTTAAGDLFQTGTYELQPYIEVTGYLGFGETVYLPVLELFS